VSREQVADVIGAEVVTGVLRVQRLHVLENRDIKGVRIAGSIARGKSDVV